MEKGGKQDKPYEMFNNKDYPKVIQIVCLS